MSLVGYDRPVSQALEIIPVIIRWHVGIGTELGLCLSLLASFGTVPTHVGIFTWGCLNHSSKDSKIRCWSNQVVCVPAYMGGLCIVEDSETLDW